MVIIDIREKEEFEAEYIKDSISCPLSQFDLLMPGILKHISSGSEVTLMCRSGNRARIALNELKKIDSGMHTFKVYEGGILKWKADGSATLGSGMVFPIMRQVQIVASTFIFTAFLLARFVHPNGIYLAFLVGCGLALAGYTGICPMVYILQKMPWNSKKMSACDTSSKPNCCG